MNYPGSQYHVQHGHAPVGARPGGESDEYSSSDDGLSFSSPSMNAKLKKNPVLFTTAANDGDDNWETSEPPTNGHISNGQSKEWGESATPAEAVRFACMRGNLEELKDLLSIEKYGDKIKVNEFFKGMKENPLITAAAHGHSDIVEYLLVEKDAKPDLRHPVNKITALMSIVGTFDETSEDKLLKGVVALVTAGANINLQDQYGMSALMMLVQRKRRCIIQYLLEKGADPNLTDPEGNTALFHAAIAGDGKTCRILLEYKADIHMVNNTGHAADDVARDKNHKLSELLYTAKVTKWKPGLNPSLMDEMDELAIEKMKVADICSIKEDASLELILSAVEGDKYLENFRKHKISYLQFLQLNEAALKEIGIVEIGIRERILDHIKQIHNAQWKESSIKKIATNKNVTASETHCMVANMKEHLGYLSSSLKYLHKRISEKPLELRYDMERSRIDTIMTVCEEMEAGSCEIMKDAISLHKLLGTLQGYTELQIAGRIPQRSLNDFKDFKKLKDNRCFYSRIGKLMILMGGISLGYLTMRLLPNLK